jgi:hypothetical protein
MCRISRHDAATSLLALQDHLDLNPLSSSPDERAATAPWNANGRRVCGYIRQMVHNAEGRAWVGTDEHARIFVGPLVRSTAGGALVDKLRAFPGGTDGPS